MDFIKQFGNCVGTILGSNEGNMTFKQGEEGKLHDAL
jgi:hypothetical protein